MKLKKVNLISFFITFVKIKTLIMKEETIEQAATRIRLERDKSGEAYNFWAVNGMSFRKNGDTSVAFKDGFIQGSVWQKQQSKLDHITDAGVSAGSIHPNEQDEKQIQKIINSPSHKAALEFLDRVQCRYKEEDDGMEYTTRYFDFIAGYNARDKVSSVRNKEVIIILELIKRDLTHVINGEGYLSYKYILEHINKALKEFDK